MTLYSLNSAAILSTFTLFYIEGCRNSMRMIDNDDYQISFIPPLTHFKKSATILVLLSCKLCILLKYATINCCFEG